MNVLFVSSGNSNYGVVPFIKSQGESLRSQGALVEYYLIKGKGLFGYIKNVPNLRRFVKKNNYDVIHAHYGLTGLVCAISLLHKPCVLSLMGDDVYGSFNKFGKRIFSSYFEMFLTQIATLSFNWIIVKSSNIRKYIIQKKNVSIIPNGVNIELFKPSDKCLSRHILKLPRTGKIILFIGDTNNERKNYCLLENAINYLDEDVIVCNPYPIDNAELPKYMNASDVFVLTSFNEGSPNVIKEAMATNCPIVSTNVGDVELTIGDTEGCYLTSFEPLDVAEKINLALEFSKKKGRTEGRSRILELGLDTEKIAEKIMNIYQEIR